MRKLSWILGTLVLLVSSGLCSAQATLSYDEVDLTAAAGGVMTITCSNGATPLWSVQLSRNSGTGVKFINFYDLTDTSPAGVWGARFNYAAPGGSGGGMLAFNKASTGTAFSSFVELHKGADYYGFSVQEVGTGTTTTTTYRVNPSNASEMTIVATRTWVNSSGGALAPPYNHMTSAVGLGVGPTAVGSSLAYTARAYADPTIPNGGCTLSAYAAGTNTRTHLQRDGVTPAIYSVSDNIIKTPTNPGFLATQYAGGEAVVLDNALTQSIGLRAGRKLRLSTDIWPYYATVGSVGLLTGAWYKDALEIKVDPYRWNGTSTAGMAAVPDGTSITKTLTFSANIGYGLPGIYAADRSIVTATSPILNNGVQESTITISLKDAFDGPVAGIAAASIVVTASGDGNTITQPVAATDASGQTVAYLKSTVAGDKTITVTVNGVAIAVQPVVAVLDKPVILLYSGKNLITDVVPGSSARQTMTITCYDVVQSKNLWSANVDRINMTNAGGSFQANLVYIRNMTDLTNPAGTFTLFQNRVMMAHGALADGLDPESYTELHKGADYFEFSVTERKMSNDEVPVLLATVVTTYRINAASDEGTRITAVRTTTNVSDAAYVPGPVNTSIVLGDGSMNPRLETGALQPYSTEGASSERKHVEMSGTTFVGDGIWMMTDNASKVSQGNLAFDDTVPMWLQGVVMDTEASARVHATVGRTVRLGCDIVGFSPANLGGVWMNSDADYYDGVWGSIYTLDWLGSSRTDHQAGIAVGASETRTFTLDINILGSSGGAPSGPPEISLALQFPWVYQNTPVATLDRHKSLLTVTIVNDPAGPQAYTTTVVESDPVGKVICQPTADPLVWSILGCRRNAAAQYANTGMATLTVTVTGVTSGLSDSDTIQIKVRPLGDITDDGFADATDKLQINRRLNSVATPYTIREMDLTGDGFADATDKLQINRMLNSIAVP